jgi:hypothetical protein
MMVLLLMSDDHRCLTLLVDVDAASRLQASANSR